MTRALKVIVFFTTNNLTIVFFSRTNSQRPRCVYQPKPKSNMGKTDAIHVLLQATCLVLSYPIFFARGPAFKKDFEIAPFKTLDLYPLMCHLLGIVPQPNNGSLENVMPLLLQETTDPPTTDPPAPDPPTAGQAEVNMQGLPVLMAISICLPILILQAFQYT